MILIDLTYQPSNFDPLNPIKFWILGILGIYCASSLITSNGLTIDFSRLKDDFSVLCVIFLITSFLIAFILTDVKSVGLIGFQGRNNGFLFYLFLLILFLYSSFKVKIADLYGIYILLTSLTLFFCAYGILQHFHHDPIKWSTNYNAILLTVGNPDFAGALLGIFAATLCGVLFSQSGIIFRLFVGVSVLLALLVIYWSQARQGLVGLTIGFGVVISTVVWQKSKKSSLVLLFIGALAGLLGILGTLQIGPLAKLLYKNSISDRGYSWHAAWQMFATHPLFGVGIDRYASWFLKYRDPKYPLLYGYQQNVNDAHNVFLEIFATAGIFAGILYLILTIYVGLRAVKAWKRYEGKNQILVSGIIAGWLVFVAQSAISPNTTSIAIWGWVFAGVIVSLSKNEEVAEPAKTQMKKNRTFISSQSKFIAFTLLSMCFLLLIVIPMNISASRMSNFDTFRGNDDAQTRVKLMKIADLAFNSPLQSPENRVKIAFGITNAGLVTEGISYFEKIIKQDKRNSAAYQSLAAIYEYEKNFKEAIKYRLIVQDLSPYSADSLLLLEKDYLSLGDKFSASKIRDQIIQIAPETQIALQASSAMQS